MPGNAGRIYPGNALCVAEIVMVDIPRVTRFSGGVDLAVAMAGGYTVGGCYVRVGASGGC